MDILAATAAKRPHESSVSSRSDHADATLVLADDDGDERPAKLMRKAGPGRKPRACVECKKQKMKCEVLPGAQACKNCQRRGVGCVLMKVVLPDHGDHRHSGLAASGETYESKIDSMRDEIQRMRNSLDALLDQDAAITVNTPRHATTDAGGGQMTADGQTQPQPQPALGIAAAGPALAREEADNNTHMAMTRENSAEPGAARGGGGGGGADGSVTVEEPMGSLYEVTRLRNIRSNRAAANNPATRWAAGAGGGAGGGRPGEVRDFISRGVISEAEAAALYKSFHSSLNHYLWVGLESEHPTFDSVRQSSELLTATILTVTALHNPDSSETFDKCYKEFLSLISSSMFSRYHSIDDVRGLCIAAFWLSEVSWKLSGHAVRVATELNIHQSFCKALEGDREHFLKARLWYMLYVCDHHASVSYGRPPMTSESLQIREHELFLQSPFADSIDQRLLSQVALMMLLTRIYDRFAEQTLPHQDPASAMLGEKDFADVRAFNLEIDQWRLRWHPRQRDNAFIGTFPPKGIVLYAYFAKLQLNSLAVRGVSLSHGRLSTERKEHANMAITSASSILTFVLEEEDLRRALVGTPLYVHTMIAFASVFLIKVARHRVLGLNVELAYVSHLLERMIVLLRSAVTSDRHLLHHIADGLEKMRNSNMDDGARNRWRSQGTAAAAAAAAAAAGVSPGQESVVSFGPMGYGPSPVQQQQQQPPQQQQQQVTASNGAFVEPNASGATHNAWESVYAQHGGEEAGRNHFSDEMAVMNDSLIYEAFGTEQTANDVYSLLTSQFSY